MMIQEAQKAPNKMNPNKRTAGLHIIIKMTKIKEKKDSKGSKTRAKSKLYINSYKGYQLISHRNNASQKEWQSGYLKS